MNCQRIQSGLVPYHFGVIEDGIRREVEEHLLRCPGCLRSFLTLKRDVETAESGPRPSPAVLDRLRRSVRSELALSEPRPWSWWERPLAIGLAAAFVFVATAWVNSLARESGGTTQSRAPTVRPSTAEP